METCLPPKIAGMLQGCRMTPVTKGMSPARVYRITGPAVSPGCFLKVDIPRPRGLTREAAACGWLQGRFPAPKALCLERTDSAEYLLTSELPGEGACFGENASNPGRTSRLLAQAMSRLHGIDASECPLDNSPRTMLELARLQMREVQETGRPMETLFRELANSIPPDEKVFCHGDFCLPNILFDGGELTGIIDLADSGVGNRHMDLALCCWSLGYNFKDEQYVNIFLDEYGRDRVDSIQLKWYSDLNLFF